MATIQLKPYAVEMQLYFRLPEEIKYRIGGIDNIEMTSAILREAALNEDYRPYINTIVFGLFVGELNPTLLVQAVKEWLALDDTQSQRVAVLIKKAFVDPHYDFLAQVYNLPRNNPAPSVAQGNVVNLKNR